MLLEERYEEDDDYDDYDDSVDGYDWDFADKWIGDRDGEDPNE